MRYSFDSSQNIHSKELTAKIFILKDLAEYPESSSLGAAIVFGSTSSLLEWASYYATRLDRTGAGFVCYGA